MNRLSQESSPYLLQHAHNPVDWYAWKEEAFARARTENKPILVSIGYSTCHWCHVMERESFESETVAAFMNKHFINIKVDREERPDVDQIYMEACQLINGSGGWPLNCFLLPDGRPFYAGTYFPPEQAYNRPSWLQVLHNIVRTFREKPKVVEDQARRLVEVIEGAGSKLVEQAVVFSEATSPFTAEQAEKIFFNLRTRFDRTEGGFGGAPKFPGTMALKFLAHYHHFSGSEEAADHLHFSLRRMIDGGIYDQLGGGFARYTTDKAWLVPHFEKMLYDNALLLELICDAYKIDPKQRYREIIEQTLDYIAREMTSPEGLFYSALDADSEGVEGKFYVWEKAEVEAVLGAEAEWFCRFYDVTEAGNWEEKNILWREKDLEAFATKHQLDAKVFQQQMLDAQQALLAERAKRIRPGLDDKTLLDWNALLISAYANAYAALGHEAYRERAQQSLDTLLDRLQQPEKETLFHTYKDGQKQYDAFLDDYAYLIKALLDVYTISFDHDLILQAERYLKLVQQHFFDKKDGLFYFTSAEQNDIIVRTKNLYDSATPAGNSILADCFLRLGIILDKADYKIQSRNMLLAVGQAIERHPTSFGEWATVWLKHTFPTYEIAVTGKDILPLAIEVRKHFLPGSILMATDQPNENFPLLRHRFDEKQRLIYVCQDYTCQRPVETIEAFEQLLKGKRVIK